MELEQNKTDLKYETSKRKLIEGELERVMKAN